jgi:two-component system, NarL family, sensor histidine kinase EvgS
MTEPDSGKHDAQPVDRTVLAEMCGGDEGFERRILRNFWQATEKDIVKLRDAVSRSDVRAVTLVAHSIKGASRTIGAQDLGFVCDRIEKAGRAAETETIIGAMPDFDSEVARLYSYLESFLGRDDSSPATQAGDDR